MNPPNTQTSLSLFLSLSLSLSLPLSFFLPLSFSLSPSPSLSPSITHHRLILSLPSFSSSIFSILFVGDVAGSVEALAAALSGLSTHKVAVAVVRTGVGAVGEADVDYARVTKGQLKGLMHACLQHVWQNE